MDIKSKIILISGPTASGKSKFALRLAKKIDGEIINADSMQIYKDLSILTARPLKKDLKFVRHHLYGFKSVKKNFSVGEWQKLTIKKIQDIKKKNKIPIIVGGTGLYFKSITDGLVKIPKIPKKFRLKITRLQKSVGQKKFYYYLTKLDPLVINKINAGDQQRSIRAYEVKKFTKISLFEWIKKTKKVFSDSDLYKILIVVPKTQLILNIKKRIEKMLKSGAINEVKKYKKLKVKSDLSSNKIIGIKEINDYLNKKIGSKILKETILIKTRQYSKKQKTWFKKYMCDWKKINYEDLTKFKF